MKIKYWLNWRHKMKRMTIEEFDRERWNQGEGQPDTKAWFWVDGSIYNKLHWIIWLEGNCLARIFITWDISSNTGRIWFEKDDDAMRYRLHW